MDSSQIEQYLGFLGQKLADMQITTSLILLGGALMITQLGNLTVYVPELEYILALKLFAGRPQDDRDIQAIAQRLSLKTRAQAWSIVNTYIPNSQLAFRSAYTSQAIDRCFPH